MALLIRPPAGTIDLHSRADPEAHANSSAKDAAAPALTQFPHLPQLDGLRAIAVGLVFMGHATLGKFAPGGFGVTIFFFLSGYLITSLLRLEWNRTGTVSFPGFYVRRFFRIQPPLWVSMACVGSLVALSVYDPPQGVSFGGIVLQFFLISNYADVFHLQNGIPGMPLWSLGVEEHFYLLFPSLFVFARRRWSETTVAALCLALCVVVLLIRCVHVIGFNETFGVYFWTHTRIDSLLFGCILALWHNPVIDRDAWRPNLLHVFGAFGLLALSVLARDEVIRHTIRYTIQGIALWVLFSWCLRDRGLVYRILLTKPMQMIGLYSYTIYLVHYFFLLAARQIAPDASLTVTAIIAGAITFAFAAAMHRWVEKPCHSLRQAVLARRAARTAKNPVATQP